MSSASVIICWFLLHFASQALAQIALIEPLSSTAFIATSQYTSDWAAHQAKYSSDPYAWAPSSKNNQPDEYLQIDLGRVVKIYSIGTKGASALSYDWVTSYNFYYSLSEPSALTSNADMTLIGALPGNTAWDTEKLNTLSTPIIARYIKFCPHDYWGGWPSLRVEVYGHDNRSSDTPTASPITANPLSPTSAPTLDPSASPTASATSPSPTKTPTDPPTSFSSTSPTASPIKHLTSSPTMSPTKSPTESFITSSTQIPSIVDISDTGNKDAQRPSKADSSGSNVFVAWMVGSIVFFVCGICVGAVVAYKCLRGEKKKEGERAARANFGGFRIQSLSSVQPPRHEDEEQPEDKLHEEVAASISIDNRLELYRNEGIEGKMEEQQQQNEENEFEDDHDALEMDRQEFEQMFDHRQVEMQETDGKGTIAASTTVDETETAGGDLSNNAVNQIGMKTRRE